MRVPKNSPPEAALSIFSAGPVDLLDKLGGLPARPVSLAEPLDVRVFPQGSKYVNDIYFGA